MRYLIIAMSTIMLIGCASNYTAPKLPSPTLAPAFYHQTVEPEYRIQVGDQLEIKSYYQPQLNQSAVVLPSGKISLMFVGEIDVSEKTPASVSEFLKSYYQQNFEIVDLNVVVVNVSPRKVYVGGEVRAPSVQEINGSLTLVQGLTMAGDFNTTANINQVLLLRKDKKGSGVTVFQVDVEKILNNEIPDVFLAKNDVVFVPRTQIAELNIYVDQYVNRMVPEFFQMRITHLGGSGANEVTVSVPTN